MPFKERFFSILFVKLVLSNGFSYVRSFIGGSVMKNEFDGVSFEFWLVGESS